MVQDSLPKIGKSPSSVRKQILEQSSSKCSVKMAPPTLMTANRLEDTEVKSLRYC